LWRKAAERAPQNRRTAVGYLSALIYAGELREAADRGAVFVEQWPQDENGPVALARIAEARGSLSEGIEQWRAALRLNPGHRQALIRLGTALAAACEFAEATACADQLVARYPAEPHGPILQAEIVQEGGGAAAAAELWRAGEQRFGNDIHFLRAYGRALLKAGDYRECLAIATRLRKFSLYEALRLEGQLLAKRAPHQDQTDFWRAAAAQLPDNLDLIRKFLHASLWGRRQADARAAFARLDSRGDLRAGDTDYVVGLCLADLEHGGRPAARKTIRTFLKSMRGKREYRAAALRLHRLILACFPNSSGAAVRVSRSGDRFLRMIRNARLGGGASEPLENVTSLEALLAQSGAYCLLDTDIDPDCCRAFIRTVRDHLANKTPFSLVRLGDGEANAFQGNSSFAALLDKDSAERENVWWGRSLEPAVRIALAADVQAAAMHADALGFPTREWLLRDVRLDPGPPLSAGKSGRGLLVVLEMLKNESAAGSLSGKILTSAHLPQDLQRWNLYSELFDGVEEAVLVSCHPNLPDVVRARFGLRTAKHVVIPPGDTMREIRQRSLKESELPPHSTVHALQELAEWPANRLVLVGAGYAGKAIIGEAAKRGGVVLDVGSIFDHWMGAHTRSYQDLA
jgi:tetratricopeptide (TPR) repeat protein